MRLQIADKVRVVYAGCGVNALSGLQKRANSIHCMGHVGLISVAHQAILPLSSVSSRGCGFLNLTAGTTGH
ncbi:hypothetical protein EcHS_A0963 [Escherichia coli HS]|nr:hypothetical protein EcHS_A0963 [Escherichia coli HS]EFJ95271.1 hypothetical protein HMPREF9540_04744 [Escherichia coli MS 115-1]